MFEVAIEMHNRGIRMLRMGQYEDAIGTFSIALDMAKKTAAATSSKASTAQDHVTCSEIQEGSSTSTSSSPSTLDVNRTLETMDVDDELQIQTDNYHDYHDTSSIENDDDDDEDKSDHRCPLFAYDGPLSYSSNPLFIATPTLGTRRGRRNSTVVVNSNMNDENSSSCFEDDNHHVFYVFCHPLTIPTDCQSSLYKLSLFMMFNLAQAFHLSAIHRSMIVDADSTTPTTAAAAATLVACRQDLECAKYMYNAVQKSFTALLGGWETFINVAVQNNVLHVHYMLGDDEFITMKCHHDLLSLIMHCMSSSSSSSSSDDQQQPHHHHHHTYMWEKQLFQNELRGFVLNVWDSLLDLQGRTAAPVA
jgi:hypothetical protein